MTSKYTRIEHFKNILEDIQGKTSIYFGENFINDIKIILKNKEITHNQIKNVLKKRNLKIYYEYIPAILKKLDIETVEFTKEEEDVLCELFEDVSKKHCILYPNESFLPYQYILYRLAEYIKYKKMYLLTLNEYNREIYDEKWKQICQELDWVFVS